MSESDNKRKFTNQFLKSKEIEVEEDGKRETWWDTKVSGLGVRVSYTGRKSFFVMYRIDGKVRRKTIGKYPDLSLHDARDKAREIHRKVAKGIDPAEEEKQEEKRFKDYVEEYRNNYLKTLADTTQKEANRIIDKHILPALGSKKIDDISPDDIRDVQDKVVQEAREGDRVDDGPKAGHRMANRVKDTISSIFENIGASVENPCREVDKKSERTGEKIDLNAEQIHTLWNVLEDEPLVTSSLIKMLLITGQRIKQVKRMRWEDIEDGVWTVPAKYTKSDEPYVLPLPNMAQEVLEELKPETGDSEWVFESPSPMNDGHVTSLSSPRQRIKEKADFEKGEFKLKSLRTTVRTNLAKLKVSPDIADRVLGHAQKTVSDRHYDAYYYVEEKREALEKWTDKLRKIIEPEENEELQDMLAPLEESGSD